MMGITRPIVPPLLSGGLFGAGLAIGGMTDPVRVRGFLDLFGSWDPTLAFVMGGAVIVMAIAWRFQARMARPLFGERFALPDRSDLDVKLIAGSALFGVGWGVAGLCPGPAVASLALAPSDALPFVAAMLAGMALHRIVPARKRRAQPQGI
jgi:uncharacterized membrane protein YedE/YeeE